MLHHGAVAHRSRTAPRTVRAARAGPLLIAAHVAAACAGGASPAPAAFDPGAALPPCAEQPPPPVLPDVAGLVLPEEATVFSVYDVGPLVQAEGVVDLTPAQARRFYEERADLEVLQVEDEGVEAEILVTDGEHRAFVKVQIACATGSSFTATVGAEADSAAVPTPAGTAAPSP